MDNEIIRIKRIKVTGEYIIKRDYNFIKDLPFCSESKKYNNFNDAFYGLSILINKHEIPFENIEMENLSREEERMMIRGLENISKRFDVV